MSQNEQIAKSKIRGYDVRNRNKTADNPSTMAPFRKIQKLEYKRLGYYV